MSIKFIILGCGSSMGVPRADSFFGNCDPKNKKNYRTRCSALVTVQNHNILIDTSPDIKSQLIRNKVKNIDKIFYTHPHADQTHGINDLRSFFIKSKKQIDIFADKSTAKFLKHSFSYCFNSYSREYPATLKLNKLNKNLTIKHKNKKIKIKAIKVKHGKVESNCFIIDKKLAYITDVSDIYNKDFSHFKNLKYLIIDCLQFKKHRSHFNLKESLLIHKYLKPKKTILTNLKHELDNYYLKKLLPRDLVQSYDGLKIIL